MPEKDKDLSNEPSSLINQINSIPNKIITDSKHFKNEHFKFGIQAAALLASCLAIPLLFKDIFIQYSIYFIVVVTLVFIVIIATFYYNDKTMNRRSSEEIDAKVKKIVGDKDE